MVILYLLLILSAFGCKTDNDCSNTEVCHNNECEHKQLYPLTGYEILGTCLVFVSSGLAGASGVGGGALYVVIFITLFFYNSSDAVALSQFTIIGASIMPSLIKVFLKHPTMNKPIIEFDINTVIISPLLIGTTVGVIMNIVLPYWIITLTLIFLLAYLSIKTFKAGFRQYRKESVKVSENKLMSQTAHEDVSEELAKILEKEKKRLPLDDLFLIFSVYMIIIVGSLTKGSNKFKSVFGIEFCSAGYWLITAALMLILLGISYVCSRVIVSKYKNKLSAGYKFDSGDIKWEMKNCISLNIAGFLAGFIGAIVGVGGALILSPVLITYNIRPEVMTATTSFMIVFTSTVSALQFLIAGKIDIFYALWNLVFSLLGSALGVFGINGFVTKYKRSSLITLTLGVFQVISGIVSLVYGIYDSVSRDNVDFGFHNYCS